MGRGFEEQIRLSTGDDKLKGVPQPHVWLITLPVFSHVKGFLQFGQLLASQGLTVTLFATGGEIRRLHAFQNGMLETWKRQGLDLRLEILSVPEFVYGDGSFQPERYGNNVQAREDAFEAILKSRLQSQSKPTCLFSDVWLPRTRVGVASEHGIPAYVYSLFSASYVSTVIYISQLESAGILKLPSSPSDGESQDEFINLPGLSLMRINGIPPDYFRGHPMYKYASRHGPSLKKSEMIVFSNCKEIERRSFRELERLLTAFAQKNCTKIPQVFAVGSTFPNKYLGDGDKAKGSGDDERHPSLKFLDCQPDSSVLFVAFGNIASFKQEQIQEIAFGLQNSQQPFLCVLNPPLKTGRSDIDDIFSVIPSECIARTTGRGMFVKWAPQMEVLAHPAIGGFLTHCGQNSTLESMYMGVPLLGWPHFSDQHINCRFLVDEAQVALEVCRGPDQFVGRKEVERAVRALLEGDDGKWARKKALEMRQLIREAVGDNGSSVKNLEALVARIRGFVDGRSAEELLMAGRQAD
ncbi:hypothetical protein Mapa_000335 [Marchantia paleacea]|nr:hypothetical protein Mapa_000335 [Marchantia paleacea]